MAGAERHKLRQYLLGQLTEAEDEQVELRLLTEPDFAEEYDIVENEVIDDYVAGRFKGEDLKQVEEYFFKSQQRRNKLKFALALKQRKSQMVTIKEHKKKTYRPYLAIAASLLLVGGGFFIWRTLSSRNQVDQGLAALQSAYRDERPLESRISGFTYAPFRSTRGPEDEKFDNNDLSLAELTLRQGLKDRPSPAAHYALGKVFLAKKDFDGAIKEFDEALKGDPNNAQLYSDLGAAWLEKGKIDVGGKEPGKGMEALGTSLENLNKALELNPNLLEARFNRALVYQNLRLSPRAIDAWRKYLEMDSNSYWAIEARKNLEKLNEHEKADKDRQVELYETFRSAYHAHDTAAAWSALALSQSRFGNYIVQRLIDEHLSFGEEGETKEAANRLGMLSFAGEVQAQMAGDLYTADLAATYGRATADQRRKLSKTRALVIMGNQSYDKSEYQPAIELYRRAQIEFEHEGNWCEALFIESLIGYSELRLAKGKSYERFERLAAVCTQKAYKSMFAQALHAQSDIQTANNEFSKVLEKAGKALQQAEMVQDDDTRLRCLQQFVSMNLKFGNYLESLGHGVTALEIAQSLPPNPRLVWTFYHEIALDFYWLNLFDAALDFEQEALRQANRSQLPFIIVRSHTQLGLILEKRGEYAAAIGSGLRAVDEAQRIADERSRLNVQSHALMRLGHLYRQSGDFIKALDSYGRALGMFEQLKLGMFRYEAHKGRFLALTRLGQTENASEELTRTLQLFEHYRTKIQDEKNRNSFFDVGHDTYDLAIDFALTRQSDPAKAFDHAERSRARSMLALTSAHHQRRDGTDNPEYSFVAPLTSAELRERLPERAQILQYGMLPDKLIIWVVSRSKIESRSIDISATELERRITDFIRLITNKGGPEQTKGAAKELYGYLITPVESLLVANDELCIVPDRALALLPFSSLLSPDDGQFFIEKFSYMFSSSSNMFLNSTETAAEREKYARPLEQILIVGNPAFAKSRFPDLSDLPSATNEARQIAAYYKTEPLIGGLAQEGRIRAALPWVEVVHIAGHFVVNPDWAGQSGLVLAENSDQAKHHQNVDGVLQASEIEKMKLSRTRLVVLSACRTGIERTYQGEGAISVARSFIVAGVPLVVATLWPVDSGAAAALMIRFHAYRKLDGLSTVAALRKAQLSMLNGDDERHRQPFDWAPFAVFGGQASF